MRRFTLAAIIIVILSASAVTAQSLVPTIYNPSFEEKEAGWGWSVMGGCQASFHSETKNPHSGSRCMTFVNKTGFAANVYGRFQQSVAVLPETEYELSVWARGEDVKDEPGLSHFTDWSVYTLNLPAGTFGWTKVSTKFRTNPGQYSLVLGLNVVNSCNTLAIDDVQLIPVGTLIKGDGIDGSLLAPANVIGHDCPGYLRVFATSSLDKPAEIEMTVSSGERKLLSKRSPIKPGENKIEVKWNSGNVPFGPLDAVVRVIDQDGKLLAETDQKINKVESPYSAPLAQVEKRFKGEFADLYGKCRARGIPVDYPTVAKTLLDQFIPLTKTDIQKVQNWRVEYAIKDFNRVLDESISEMQACLKDPKLAPNARRYRTSRAAIKGFSFIADRKDSRGKKDHGPVFFVGYGHFSQLRKDMPRFPGYGVNIIQSAEFGPSAVFPEEGKVSLEYPKILVKTLDDAAKNNVKVDFLLSPHYFPNWAIQKWPHLAKGGGGFLCFVPDEKEAKQVVEDFLEIVIPMIKDKPALGSICLSNEPFLNDTARADNTRSMWNAYLTKAHGDVKTMNERYHTSYQSFDDVPMGGGGLAAPEFYDWCMFNSERFTGWHKWMADVIHSMAPNIPVHAKTMSTWLNRDFVASGCDAEMFGAVSQIAGNDCYFMGSGGSGWAEPWQFQNISYDLQRSVTGKPIFNSENHLSPDRATFYVAPEHFRTALWQGAMHGQSATTIWAWERTFDAGSDLYGLVMDRPGCAYAVGTTSLDLNRFADEVAAIQNAKSPVAILYSIASLARDPGYVNAVNQAYVSLCFHGFRVDFISEKQLQSGRGASYKMIVFPESGHVLPATLDAITKLPESVKIVLVGNCLSKDPYGNPLPQEQVDSIKARALVFDTVPDGSKLWSTMHEKLSELGGPPDVSVVDAITGDPVWGLEWLPAKVGDRTVISMVNLRDKPAYVKVLVSGRRVHARDLLSLGGRDLVRVIKPASPVLAEAGDL